MKKIIVIGGGASGIMAAGQAAEGGAKVLLLEKNEALGRKICISGKGRCNLTNTSDVADFLQHFNSSGRFLRQPFSHFFVPQLMQFFDNESLPLVTERGGRVFPSSGKATDVVHHLQQWLQRVGVKVHYSSPVTGLAVKDNRLQSISCNGTVHQCDAAILTTGGASYPATGSSGDGYNLAKTVGHSIISLRPALIPLTTNESSIHQMAGLDLRNIGFRIFIDGKRKKIDFGEVGFTRFGIGGPVTLTHSRYIVDCLKAGKHVEISLDLKPALHHRKLDARLQRDLQKRHSEELQSVLRGLLPEKMIPTCLHYTSLYGGKPAGDITAKERVKLRTWLKNFRFPVNGHRPLREAIVTAGGVNVKEVNPRTMESLITPGLYLAGELLDIDGDTGGYNLQAAFSTGWLAGRSAAVT